jgi:hypothetical protein
LDASGQKTTSPPKGEILPFSGREVSPAGKFGNPTTEAPEQPTATQGVLSVGSRWNKTPPSDLNAQEAATIYRS